jgi:hypothetical protein
VLLVGPAISTRRDCPEFVAAQIPSKLGDWEAFNRSVKQLDDERVGPGGRAPERTKPCGMREFEPNHGPAVPCCKVIGAVANRSLP